MRMQTLIPLSLFSLLAIVPAAAHPLPAGIAQLTAAAIAPIEIRELTIKVHIVPVQQAVNEAEEAVVDALSGDPHLTREQRASAELVSHVLSELPGMLEPSEDCITRDGVVDSQGYAAEVLSRLAQSQQVKNVTVRGWDMKQKKAGVTLDKLAAKPTPDGLQTAIIAILIGLQREAEIGTLGGSITHLTGALDIVQGWFVPDLDSDQSGM